ncbi:hypothetical protein AB595_21705 [Massilia sp. WF1]|uniref:hypothetical protein n=1 Tax=unclassified Massilia TaxID=2609279 RepID=UPI000649C4EF|nr:MULTISPECIES: hypothetical protein [unclassified Massilia]ALK97001.1 hypothetical protein AM586_12785 [Massilia sp. WG5]KLU34715.1 hypothetical protein AB595_21705 [Massilia sp. WF1]
MPREDFNDERDVQVAKLAEQLVCDWTRKLQAGDQRAISDLHNTVLERFSQDDVKALFVQAVTGRAIADVRFASLAHDAMYEVCKADAERGVAFMEQRRTESRNDNRIAQAELARMH